MSYNKSCVKLLSVIEKYEKYTVFYTEFDGNFSIGDKLYIMVIDSGSTEYQYLDSLQISGSSYANVGYELLSKDNNKLTLNIIYDDLISSGITSLTDDNCYIGRVYIKSGSIHQGTINGTMMYNVSLLPAGYLNLVWRQGILATTPSVINYIDFNTYNGTNLIVKTEINNNIINSYYTINNYNIGLSIINLLDDRITLNLCNINAGTFNNCDFYGTANKVNQGVLNNCYIGGTNIINGGTFNNCTLHDRTVVWKNGIWDYSITGTSNTFRTNIWSGGTWRNGVFPSTADWIDGRFMRGTFNGLKWVTGSFGTKKSVVSSSTNVTNIILTSDTIFSGSTWYGGSFNNGVMCYSSWYDGEFNDGTFIESVWDDGIFNNGRFLNSTWNDGIFNDGTLTSSIWYNGTFNGGTFTTYSSWYNGIFNDGLFTDYSEWYNGRFYDGKITEYSIWHDGRFYKGSIFDSFWNDGDFFYGVVNNVDWSGGTWYNGIANSIYFHNGTWKNGIFNYGYFYNGTWENGSFNSGYFNTTDNPQVSVWKNGNFYYGEFNGIWSGGTFYTGKQTTVPNKYIVGKEYVQYNKSGLFSNRYNTVRLPSKKKY